MTEVRSRGRLGAVYLSIAGMTFLVMASLWVIHFGLGMPVAAVFILGILIRLLLPGRFIAAFTFLFPLISFVAVLGNQGYPFSYLVLPIFLLSGILVSEGILRSDRIFTVASSVSAVYLWLIIITAVSVFFVFLRWSNLTVSGMAFLKDTPVAPGGVRVSFAVLFPVIFISVPALSYLYFLYASSLAEKKSLMFAFLSGHSVSILWLFFQKWLDLRLFRGPQGVSHGLSSDISSFGFLSVVALLVSGFLIVDSRERLAGIGFAAVALAGIFNSSSRVGLLAVAVCLIWWITRLSGIRRLALAGATPVLLLGVILAARNGEISQAFGLLKEVDRTITGVQEIVDEGRLSAGGIRSLLAGREFLWSYSLRSGSRFPLSGVGGGNFLFWVMYDQVETGFHPARFKHDLPSNHYLYMLAALGFFGLLAWLCFLWILHHRLKRTGRWLFVTVIIILFFGSYLWVSEAFLAFWLIVSVAAKQDGRPPGEPARKRVHLFWGIATVLTITASLVHFDALHPLTWSRNLNIPYDYGFWYSEVDRQGRSFHWTQGEAGWFVEIDEQGKSDPILLVCEAPLEHLPGGVQVVEVYWKDKLYRRVRFRRWREVCRHIKGQARDSGMIHIRVQPVFNLKQMGLGRETRNLGVKVYRRVAEQVGGRTGDAL